MPYVDGFVLAVPKARLDDYKALAGRSGAMWMDYGALSYVECIGDDVPVGELTSHRPANFAVLDQVAFRRREDEVAIGDIYLSAREIDAVKALRH